MTDKPELCVVCGQAVMTGKGSHFHVMTPKRGPAHFQCSTACLMIREKALEEAAKLAEKWEVPQESMDYSWPPYTVCQYVAKAIRERKTMGVGAGKKRLKTQA